ncbi:hypothetical protein FRC06_002339, partial [Ceratobasidium sp. 370]
MMFWRDAPLAANPAQANPEPPHPNMRQEVHWFPVTFYPQQASINTLDAYGDVSSTIGVAGSERGPTFASAMASTLADLTSSAEIDRLHGMPTDLSSDEEPE